MITPRVTKAAGALLTKIDDHAPRNEMCIRDRLPVVRFSFPPQRCVVQDAEGYLKFKWPEYRNSRSQDLEPYYHDAGPVSYTHLDVYKRQDRIGSGAEL